MISLELELQVSVSVAGRFVFAQLLGIGPVTSITMGRTECKGGSEYVGKCSRAVGIFEVFLELEADGHPPERAFLPNPPPEVTAIMHSEIAAYRKTREAFAMALLLYGVSCAAASVEVAGDPLNENGGLSADDADNVARGAWALAPAENISGVIASATIVARRLCGRELKGAIVRAADCLRAKGTLDAAECQHLWDEIRPRRGWLCGIQARLKANPRCLFDAVNCRDRRIEES